MLGKMDSYSREPYACRFCARPFHSHGWGCSNYSPSHRGVAPEAWLILARMRIRRTDPDRWIPWNDMRATYRKWKQ